MSKLRRTVKSKVVNDNDSTDEVYLKESPKLTKSRKRQIKNDNFGLDDSAKLISNSKKKMVSNIEDCQKSRQKLLNVMSNQIETWKQGSNYMLKNLSEILMQFESDYAAMKDNEQKLEHLVGALLKCIHQATLAHKQKMLSLKELHATFKEKCGEIEAQQRAETEDFADDLEEDIKKLSEKLILETKRNKWETLRKTFFQAMENDF